MMSCDGSHRPREQWRPSYPERVSCLATFWKSSAGSRQTILTKDSATHMPTRDVPKEQGAEGPLTLPGVGARM